MPLYPGDPLTPGVGATKDAKRLDRQRGQDHHQDSRCCRFPTRDAQPLLAALKGPVAPDELARRAAHHLSRGTRPGESPPEGAIQLGHQAALRRDRQDSRLRPIPTSGSFAAIITMPGSTAPKIPVSGTVALMEEARGLRDTAEAGMEAEAHHHLLRVGRRGAGAAGLHRVGRSARRRTAPARRRLHQYATATAAAISAMGGSHSLEKFINGVARDIAGSREKDLRCGSATSSKRIADAKTRRRPQGSARPRRPAHRRAGLGLATTPSFSIIWASRR